jgi:hypothetical protein
MRKSILLFGLIFSLLLIPFVYSLGCCYIQNQDCIIQIDSQQKCDAEAGTKYHVFYEGNEYCVYNSNPQLPQCIRGCCCLSPGFYPTTQEQCEKNYNKTFKPHLEWSTQEYLAYNGFADYGPVTDTCRLECDGHSTCTSNCEANSDCICGSTLTDNVNKFCCISNGNAYSDQGACTSACQGTGIIKGYVVDVNGNKVEGASVFIGNERVTSNMSGMYYKENIPPEGILSAEKANLVSKQLSYDLTQKTTYNITLYSIDLKCDEGKTKSCPSPEENCEAYMVCEDGIFSDCRVDPASCRLDPVCGNKILEVPSEQCDGSTISCPVVQGKTADCVNCVCSYPGGRCGDMEKNQGEECDPDRSNPTTFLLSLKSDQQCASEFALNCTSDCRCIYSKSTCGDGKITYNEQCEWSNPPTYTQTTADSIKGCQASNCGKPGTVRQCNCINSNVCGDGVLGGTEQCELNSGTICPNNGICNLNNCTCSDSTCGPAKLLNLAYNKSENYVNLSWEHYCKDQLDSYRVYRCQADNTNKCINDSYVIFPVLSMKSNYVDSLTQTGLIDTNYCYWLESVFSLENEYLNISDNTKLCIKPNTACMKEGQHFCFNNTRMVCNNNFEATALTPDPDFYGPVTCDQYHVCKQFSNHTECVYQANCSYCNGLLSSFGEETGYIYFENKTTQTTLPCEDMQVPCYLDSTRTTVDKYYACRNLTSCYDYKSEYACRQDKCSLFGCEWITSTEYASLGLGICRPKDESLQRCNLCMDKSNEFYGDCNKNNCILYGTCYYDMLPNVNQAEPYECMHKRDMSCDYYDYESECIGGTNSSINTTWNSGYSLKTKGSNNFTIKSKDFLNLGKCKWLGDSCAKDSDQNIIANERLDDQADTGKYDCALDDKKCQKDTIPPRSSFSYNKEMPGMPLNITYYVYDDSYGKKSTKVYTCIVPFNQECYPNKTEENTIFYTITSSGNYNLFYFAEDYSHNLETVKKATFYVDAQPPIIKLAYQIDSSEADPLNYEGIYFSNLTISFNVTNENATCSAYLLDSESKKASIVSDINKVYSSKFIARYNFLKDDLYNYVVSCRDKAGNINETNFVIKIEEDSSLSNPQPSTTLRSGQGITISIDTISSASCRYDFTTEDYNNMLNEFTDQGTYHYKTIDIGGNGIKIINVKCLFPDGKIKGNRADRIKFAIDDIPPETLITNFKDNTLKNISGWRTKIEFGLLCSDPPIYENDNPKLKNWAFGCGNVSYGTNYAGGNIRPVNPKYVSKYNVSMNDSGIWTINYSSVDNGRNYEKEKTEKIYIDNLDYEFDIIIRDAYSGEIVTKVRADRQYSVEISSPKLAQVPYDPDYYIQVKSLSFQLLNGKVDINLPGDSYGSKIPATGTFYIDGTVFKDIKDKNTSFDISGLDSHNIASKKIRNGKTFIVTTALPKAPVFDPALEKYKDTLYVSEIKNGVMFIKNYPLYNYGDIFYTDDAGLFVSGKFEDFAANVQFKLRQENLPRPEYYTTSYDQTNNANATPLATKVLSQASLINTNKIYLKGDAGPYFKEGNYIEFKDHQRTDYTNYKEFYYISEVNKIMSGFEVASTELKIVPNITEAIPSNIQVYVYEKQYPSSWFGASLNLHEGYSNLSVEVLDESGNKNSAEAKLFLDLVDPNVLDSNLYPLRGDSTNNNLTNISVIITDKGSGILKELVVLEIKNTVKNTTYSDFVFENISCESEDEQYKCYKITHVPSSEFNNGLYTVYLNAYDLAHNRVIKNWFFYVSAGSPNKPDFWIKDALPINPGPNGIWYINKVPDFVLNFSDTEPITLLSKELKNLDLITFYTDTISCNRNKNFFDCSIADKSLPEGNYRITVSAEKTFPNGTTSPPGTWSFLFTIDKTPPVYKVNYTNPTNSRNQIVFEVNTSNEPNHPLLGYLFFNNQEIKLTSSEELELPPKEFYTPDEFNFNVPLGDVQDIIFNFKLMDYAGNSNTKENLPLRIDNELPNISLSNVTSHIIYVIRKPTLRNIEVTKPDVIVALYRVNISGTVLQGKKGYDVSEFYIRDILGADTELSNNCSSNSNSYFCEGIFKSSNIYIPGNLREETLNNLSFTVVDEAQNILRTSLFALKDLKPPQLINWSIK